MKRFVTAAAALGGLAVLNTLFARRAEKRNPPTGRFVTVRGVSVHYIERGVRSSATPPVVLLHGNVLSAFDFEVSGVIDKLCKHHRVIAFDRPGFGYTDRPSDQTWTPEAQADLIAAAMHKLAVESAIIVGHSWGTLVALAMALETGAAVRGLVLMSGYYFPTKRLDSALVAVTATPVLGDVLRYTIVPPLELAMQPVNYKAMFSPDAVTERFAEDFPHGLTARPSQIRATARDGAMMVAAARRLQEYYYALTDLPIAIMAGDRDRIVDVEQAKRLAATITGSHLMLLKGHGHMFHHVAPGDVAHAVDWVTQEVRGSLTTGGFAPTVAAV